MSEDIIIDGVNVAECYYMYDNEDLNYMCQNGIGTCICRENKNCHYKQLKRLQAENERLKSELKSQQMINLKQQDIAQDYWNALEEIREMFDNCCFKANFLNNCDSDCKYINECNGELSIIQKRISEVLK